MEYMKYILDTLEKIVNTPSPSGSAGRRRALAFRRSTTARAA